MQTSKTGLALIKAHEGLRFHVYNDVAGFATIGYGHKLGPGESFPDGIDLVKANMLLAADVRNCEYAVRKLVKVPLTQGQFDALVDFVFNLGAARLEHSTLLEKLNCGDYDSVPAQLLCWDHAGMREIPALEARRKDEAMLWNS